MKRTMDGEVGRGGSGHVIKEWTVETHSLSSSYMAIIKMLKSPTTES